VNEHGIGAEVIWLMEWGLHLEAYKREIPLEFGVSEDEKRTRSVWLELILTLLSQWLFVEDFSVLQTHVQSKSIKSTVKNLESGNIIEIYRF